MENRLSTATNGSTTETNVCDEANHRIERMEANASNFSGTAYFYGPDDKILVALTLSIPAGSPVATYVQYENIYFGSLLLGTTTGYVSTENSALVDRLGTARTGYPYGTDITGGAQQQIPSGLDFATYLNDSITGMQYANQRWYSAGFGRCLTAGPNGKNANVHTPGGWNRYSYSNGDPINKSDPMGLCVDGVIDFEDTDNQPCDQLPGTGTGDGSSTDADGQPVFHAEGVAMQDPTPQTPGGDDSGGSTASDWGSVTVPTVANAVCTGAAVAAGASAGALIGEGFGGFLGGLAGAGGGTLVAPGIGTVGGGIAGGSAGAGIGAGVGGFIGGLVGVAASNVLCSKGGGPSFGGNSRQNKQANDAKRNAEKEVGKRMTDAQEEQFHDTSRSGQLGDAGDCSSNPEGGNLMTTLTLNNSLRQLETKFVSGITRTQGSMFFLEIGNLYLRSGAKRPHGEWHFLFELCHWRISSPETITVGSDDDPDFIDAVFPQLSLGSIVSADVEAHSNDLRVIFSSGSSLRTLTTSAKATDEEWTQWRLYCPHEDVWAVDGGGRADFRNIHSSRT